MLVYWRVSMYFQPFDRGLYNNLYDVWLFSWISHGRQRCPRAKPSASVLSFRTLRFRIQQHRLASALMQPLQLPGSHNPIWSRHRALSSQTHQVVTHGSFLCHVRGLWGLGIARNRPRVIFSIFIMPLAFRRCLCGFLHSRLQSGGRGNRLLLRRLLCSRSISFAFLTSIALWLERHGAADSSTLVTLRVKHQGCLGWNMTLFPPCGWDPWNKNDTFPFLKPSRKLTWQWKKRPQWRCISYKNDGCPLPC